MVCLEVQPRNAAGRKSRESDYVPRKLLSVRSALVLTVAVLAASRPVRI
jgi:hypothetical protein